MKSALSILISLVFLLLSPITFQVEAQSLMQKAQKAEQRAKALKQQESSRYNSVLDSRNLSEYNRFIADYPRSRYTPEIKKRAAEMRAWNSATSQNSVPAYEKYLSTTQYHWYDSDARIHITNLKQAAEKKAWEKVRSVGTLAAYEAYLRDNPSSGFRTDAQKAIAQLKATKEWNNIRYSGTISQYEAFIRDYPNSTEVVQAQNKLHELKGRQYYDAGNLDMAYSEFSKLSSYNVSPSNKDAYNAVIEYHEYKDLKSYPTETLLLTFKRKYPYSKYTTEINNMLAIAKAKNLGDYASKYNYDEALSYASDTYTRNIVKSYISLNKKKQKDRRNAWRSYERQQNGGLINIGLDFLDLGLNGVYDDGTLWHYNIGLMLRIGNFKDRVQFAIGIKPGILGYTQKDGRSYYDDYYDDYYYYDDDDDETKTAFHMPIVGQLKLNLFKMSENSRFYLYGKYQYNAIREKTVESDMAWGAGFGFAWRHIDWGFYYRQDIGAPQGRDKAQHYFGTSVIYYWTL